MFFPVIGTPLVTTVFKGIRDFAAFNEKVRFWYKISFFIIPLVLFAIFAMVYTGKSWKDYLISSIKALFSAVFLMVLGLFMIDYVPLKIISSVFLIISFALLIIKQFKLASFLSKRLELPIALIAGFVGSMYILDKIMQARSKGFGVEEIKASFAADYVLLFAHVIWYALFLGAFLYQQFYVSNKGR